MQHLIYDNYGVLLNSDQLMMTIAKHPANIPIIDVEAPTDIDDPSQYALNRFPPIL